MNSILENNDRLILTEMFKESKLDFDSEKEKRVLNLKLTTALNEIDNLQFRNIKIDNDGYILMDIDIEEKSRAFGELGYTSTVIWDCKELSMGQIIEQMINCVMERFNEEMKIWVEAKKIYCERFGKQKLTGRSEAYAYLEIYKGDLKQSF